MRAVDKTPGVRKPYTIPDYGKILPLAPQKRLRFLIYRRVGLAVKSYEQFCADLASMDGAIVAAFVISGGIQGSHVKLNVPQLKDEDARRLAEQTDAIMRITGSNERLFGQVVYVLVHHESIDGMFFPVGDGTTVLVGLVRPYDQDRMAQRVADRIKRSPIWQKNAFDSI